MSETQRNVLVVLLPLTITACAPLPELGTNVQAVALPGGHPSDCAPCGHNTELPGALFDEFNLDGEVKDGVWLIGAYDTNDNEVELEVTRQGVLLGRSGGTDHPLLPGSRIVIGYPTENGTNHVDLEIVDNTSVRHWVEEDGPEAVAYQIEYDDPHLIDPETGNSARRNLCPDVVQADSVGDEFGPRYFLTFRGDRYDHGTRRIQTGLGTRRWVNFACYGAVPSKMHLARHTWASQTDDVRTRRHERQAYLNMLTANYCGDGESYTEHGTPLRYGDANGYFDPADFGGDMIADESFEAWWNKSGAMCLNEPRRPDIVGEIDELPCDLLACPSTNPETAYAKGAQLISGTP